jgi:cytoskeletal protein CcmA (bactofilin family)
MEARRTAPITLLALACAALFLAAGPAGARMAVGMDLGSGIGPIVPLFEIKAVVHGVDVDVDTDAPGEPGDPEAFLTRGNLLIAPGDTLDKDLYQWGQLLEVDGTLNGDVVTWVQTAKVTGVITEDMNVAAQDVAITGVVGDDVRTLGQSLSLDGKVGGDVLVVGATVGVSDKTFIGGDLRAACGVATVNGTVGGDLALYAGQVNLDGKVLGNATIVSDGGIVFGENAEIAGNLVYESPEAVELRPGMVKGTVTFTPQLPEEDRDFELPEGAGAFFHIFLFFAAIIAGSILISLTKDHANRTAGIIRRRPLKSLAIGFIAFICVPVVIVITIALILTIPLAMVLTLGYLIAAYVAKFYVAIWLGSIIVRRAPDSRRSPVPVMLLGLLILYVATALPFVGTLITFLTVFLGLGALLQRKETRLDQVFEQQAEPNGALPGAFPGTPAGA